MSDWRGLPDYKPPLMQVAAAAMTLWGTAAWAAWPFWQMAAISDGVCLLLWVIAAPAMVRECKSHTRYRRQEHIRAMELSLGFQPSAEFWDER